MNMLKGMLMTTLGLGCAGAGADANANEAQQWVAEGAMLLDVRTPEEFRSGHLRGAVNIPVQELADRIDEIDADRVVVYCRSGARSARAAQMLRAAGKEVLDIGTMARWGKPEDIVR